MLSSKKLVRLIANPVVAFTVATMGFSTPASSAEDLSQIFDLAAENDPEIRQARANYNATHTQVAQGLSQLLPTVTLTGRSSRDTTGVDGEAPSGGLFASPSHSFANGFNSKGYGLSIRQNLLNFEAWYSFQSIKSNDQVAALNLAQSEQQLILRVASAYFDVLRSQDNLASFQAEEDASERVLEQTRERFEVGLVPITDVYDSQANYDLARVNRLVEENNLNQRYEALGAITGQVHNDLTPLDPDFPIENVDSTIENWVTVALQNNLSVRAAELDFEAKKDDARAARSALLPTLDVDASYNWSQSGNPLSFTPNLPSENTSITLNLTVPLYTGGLNGARKRQAYYTRDASEEALLKNQRDTTVSIRNSYRSLQTDVLAVEARAQAIISAQSALEATEVGAEVGTRNVVDVVLAQRNLFQARREYANARYNYVINTLNLKQAAGTLSPQEIYELNEWLSE